LAYVPVPRDLTTVKVKILFGLSARQLICFGSAAVIGIPAYFMTRGALGNSSAVLVMIGLMMPAFFIAMYEKDGQPAEKILRNVLRLRWFYPSKRPYKTENFYHILEKEALVESSSKAVTAGKTSAAKITANATKRKNPAGHVKKPAEKTKQL